MGTKICNKCKIEKLITEYHKNGDKLYSICKICKREQRLKNYDKEKVKRKEYEQLNRDKINQQKRIYQKGKIYQEYRLKRKDQLKEYNKKYYAENKDKINQQKKRYIKFKEQNDTLFKLKRRVQTRIYLSITKQGYTKNKRTQEILGCTIDEFKQYLQSQFQSWMTWDNYGLYNGTKNYGWDIDHIIPISSAITEEDIIRLNHYTNLQPMCSYINRDVKRNLVP